MRKSLAALWIVPALTLLSTAAQCVGIGEYWIGNLTLIASFNSTDGYDSSRDMWTNYTSKSWAVRTYHVEGPDWSGPTGFYSSDQRGDVPLGGSTTWDPMYLWANDRWMGGDRVSLPLTLYTSETGVVFDGWQVKLYIDYVPEYLNWTGPWEFDLPTYGGAGRAFTLPIPKVANGLDGVRMHITAYAPPIPEPSSLLALAAPLAGLAVWRRRRR